METKELLPGLQGQGIEQIYIGDIATGSSVMVIPIQQQPPSPSKRNNNDPGIMLSILAVLALLAGAKGVEWIRDRKRQRIKWLRFNIG